MDQELSKRERSQGSGTEVPLSDSGAGQNLAEGLGTSSLGNWSKMWKYSIIFNVIYTNFFHEYKNTAWTVFLCKHTIKKSEDTMGVWTPNLLSGYAIGFHHVTPDCKRSGGPTAWREMRTRSWRTPWQSVMRFMLLLKFQRYHSNSHLTSTSIGEINNEQQQTSKRCVAAGSLQWPHRTASVATCSYKTDRVVASMEPYAILQVAL